MRHVPRRMARTQVTVGCGAGGRQWGSGGAGCGWVRKSAEAFSPSRTAGRKRCMASASWLLQWHPESASHAWPEGPLSCSQHACSSDASCSAEAGQQSTIDRRFASACAGSESAISSARRIRSEPMTRSLVGAGRGVKKRAGLEPHTPPRKRLLHTGAAGIVRPPASSQSVRGSFTPISRSPYVCLDWCCRMRNRPSQETT